MSALARLLQGPRGGAFGALGCSVPLGGSQTRGPKPACAGLDRSNAWRVWRQAAPCARGLR